MTDLLELQQAGRRNAKRLRRSIGIVSDLSGTLTCPICGSSSIYVYASRAFERIGTKRYKRCRDCNHTWPTIEVSYETWIKVSTANIATVSRMLREMADRLDEKETAPDEPEPLEG